MSSADPEYQLRCLITTAMHDLALIENHAFASQRTTADQIEHEVRERLLGMSRGFMPPAGPRRPGDVTWHNFHINIKSTDLDKSFHMPNLISADNLWKLLSQGQHFMLLRFSHNQGRIQHWDLWNIQDISWDHLTLGALGAGQIQIRDALKPLTAHDTDRESWRNQWKQRMIDFYQKERVKIDKRIEKWSNR